MKLTLNFALTLAMTLILAFAFSDASAATEKATCKVKTNDIGTIIGRGSNHDTAFEDAATQCFERRSQIYRFKKGANVDEDSGLVMIDMCANIRCNS